MVVVISDVVAAEVVSAAGTPALRVSVVLNDGTTGNATVATPGRHAGGPGVGLLDGGDRLHGLGVLKAVNHVNTTLHDELRGQSPFNQQLRDVAIADADGTDDWHRLGVNATFATSLAVARAAANFEGVPLYRYLGGVVATAPRPAVPLARDGADFDALYSVAADAGRMDVAVEKVMNDQLSAPDGGPNAHLEDLVAAVRARRTDVGLAVNGATAVPAGVQAIAQVAAPLATYGTVTAALVALRDGQSLLQHAAADVDPYAADLAAAVRCPTLIVPSRGGSQAHIVNRLLTIGREMDADV